MSKLLYTELEYIESTGTQWIDTKFKPNNNTFVKVSIDSWKYRVDDIFFGVYSNGAYYYHEFVISSGSIRSGYGIYENENSFNARPLDNIPFIIEKTPGYCKYVYNNTEQYKEYISNSFRSPYSMFLFAGSRDGQRVPLNYCSSFKLKYFVCQDGVNSLNLIPAKDPQGVVCMYDTISETFFYNQGSGEFIAGPIIAEVDAKTTIKEETLLRTNSLYVENCPNIDGWKFLNKVYNTQLNSQEEKFNLQRIRVDIGTQEGSIGNLLKFKDFKGFNDNYEPIDKPRSVGTYILTEDCFQEDIDEALASFGDGLTIDSSNITVLSFDMFAVQTIDSTKPNYNPAVGIILWEKNIGNLVDPAEPTRGWYLKKTTAATITNINTWFASKTTMTDTLGLCGEIGETYDFDSFNEFQYFTGVTALTDNCGFLNCSKLTSLLLPVNLKTITQRSDSYYSIGLFEGCSKLDVPVEYFDSIENWNYTYSIFRGCAELKWSRPPINMANVYSGTFAYCTSLNEEFDIGDRDLLGISNFGHAVGHFVGCTSLRKVLCNGDMPLTLESTSNQKSGTLVFYGCSKLEEFIAPNITKLGVRMFEGTKLTICNTPSVTGLASANGGHTGNHSTNPVFPGTLLPENFIHGDLTFIGANAFRSTKINDILNIHDCTLGSYAFANVVYPENTIITLKNITFYNDNGAQAIWNSQNIALHFLDDNPSTLSSTVFLDNTIIYVGNGSSYEHDLAVLEGGTYGGVEYVGYKNATNWSALYNAGRLKTWWEHEHPTT